MSLFLTAQIKKFDLDDIPNLKEKAAEYFDTICTRITAPTNKLVILCRPAIAIQLACESFQIEFNEVLASHESAVDIRMYQRCLTEVKVALGLAKKLTLEELDVQLSPPDGVIAYTRKLLQEFKDVKGSSMPVTTARNMDWSNSIYVAAAFYLVCRHAKKRVGSKAKLIELACTKTAAFTNAAKCIESFGKKTLAEVSAGGITSSKTPSKRRVAKARPNNTKSSTQTLVETEENTPQPNNKANSAIKNLGQLAGTLAHTSVETPKNVMSKNESVEPLSRAFDKQPQKKRCRTDALDKPKQTLGKRQKTQSTTLVSAQKLHNGMKTTTLNIPAKENSKKLRIGIVSMINDRDYKKTQLYENYIQWRTKVLSA